MNPYLQIAWNLVGVAVIALLLWDSKRPPNQGVKA